MPFTSPPEQEWEAAWYAEKGIEKSWDFGYKASMYVDATEAPWSTGGYRMHEYITQELPQLIEANFAALPGKKSIFGHSMGGHGALICAMRNPGAYASASAFSPICNPARAPWGLKSFTHYLGADEAKWAEWDACALASEYAADAAALPILVDQGEADSFLVDGQLLPEALVAACDAPANITLEQGKTLGDAAGDVFPMAAAEGWSDPLVRKALQFIERRQRNRSAVAKSPFASLDEAVAAEQAPSANS
jgi:S-formylglutathione hydrolase